jgi:hypothetical protein
MKIILAIFCGLMVLFAGGCAVILIADGSYSSGSGSVALAVVPGSVAALNVLMLLGMFGKKEPQRWAFYVLAAADMLAALALAAVWASFAPQIADIAVIALPLIGLFLLKAVLTVLMVRRLEGPGES